MGTSEEEKSTKIEKPSSPLTAVSSTVLTRCCVNAFVGKLEF
jgi:hypothetical protein